MSGLKFIMSDVTSFLPDKVYSGLQMCFYLAFSLLRVLEILVNRSTFNQKILNKSEAMLVKVSHQSIYSQDERENFTASLESTVNILIEKALS